jgi:hypothetical protein
MRWGTPAHQPLVEAIVDSFSDFSKTSRTRLSAFNQKQWEQTCFWLDASGLALYFLEEAEVSGFDGAIPAWMLKRLRRNLNDNRSRSSSMFEEFVRLNHTFSRAAIRYANLKGLTLVPESCPDESLRCQLDFDFLVEGEDLELCRLLLQDEGYQLVAASSATWEFKAGNDTPTSMKDHYKPRPQRCVELHFKSDEYLHVPGHDERLDRLSSHNIGRDAFPALSHVDQLIGQAIHLLGHLRGELTRPAWLLEFRRHVLAHRGQSAFWQEVRLRAARVEHASVALGISTWLASNLFGSFRTPELDGWAVDALPPRIRLWLELYGRKALLADFPGTKLYLLLDESLHDAIPSGRRTMRQRLLPFHRAPRILQAGANDSLRKRLERELYHANYAFFRLRFHLKQGLAFALESGRWNMMLRKSEQTTQRFITTPQPREDEVPQVTGR